MTESSIHQTKADLRAEFRAKTRELTPEEKAEGSLSICTRLQEQPVWRKAGTVLYYAPLPDEPDIWPLVDISLLRGHRVALPRFLPAKQAYEICLVRDPERDLVIGRYGIREPRPDCAKFALNQLDFVLVPGVAFDLSGARLGRGKGYYDRLLASVSGSKCGVGFEVQITDALPTEKHDALLSHLLTPIRWITTRRAAP